MALGVRSSAMAVARRRPQAQRAVQAQTQTQTRLGRGQSKVLRAQRTKIGMLEHELAEEDAALSQQTRQAVMKTRVEDAAATVTPAPTTAPTLPPLLSASAGQSARSRLGTAGGLAPASQRRSD